METTPGKRVQQLREAKGYKSITAFAEFTGLKIGTLSALEGDKSSPSMETLLRINRAFPDISMEWLISGDGPMLRDARTLAPVAPLPAAPPLTSGPETIDHALELMLRGQLLDRLADKDALIAMLRAENEDLRKKPFDSSDAAGPDDEAPVDPSAPTFAGGVAPQPRLRVQGLRRFDSEAAELS